jgi:inhibitor of cysteine peptidase
MSERTNRNSIFFGISTAIVLGVALIMVMSAAAATAGDGGLKTFNSYSELSDFIAQNVQEAHNVYYGTSFGLLTREGVFALANSQAGADTSANKYSTTNIQVSGVDEGDIVKTDGTYLYVSSNNLIYIMRAYPVGAAEILAKIEINGTWNLDLYINGDKLIVLGNQQAWLHYGVVDYVVRDGIATTDSFIPYYWYQPTTFVNVYDVSDRASPSLERSLEINGTLGGSRLIGDYLYLMVNKPAIPYWNATVELPAITNNNETTRIPADEVKYSDISAMSYDFITIIAVNTADSTEEPAYETFLTNYASTMYVSHTNMYLAVPKYGTRILFGAELAANADDIREKTLIYRISLDGNVIKVQSEGAVPGTVLNQFSMDEYNGYFRIATTEWAQNGTLNNLYVLDANLDQVGSIEGLAQGERIYSVRFAGEKGYIVTFRQVDPFFSIDLSDPANPEVMGILKIPGFSTYMHPYDDNTIIGIGTEEGKVKLSMFDVSNFSNPREIDKFVIDSLYSYTEVGNDHKALLFDRELGLMVFPVSMSVPAGREWLYWQGAFVFDVTLEDGFVLRGTITQQDDMNSSNWQKTIRRSLYIEDVLYTISEKMVKMSSLDTLKTLGTIELS